MTVVPLLDSQKPEEHDLQRLFTEWAATDDVFRPEFLSGVVFLSTTDQEANSSQIPSTLRQTWGTNFCVTLSTNVPKSGLSTGPHLLEEGKLFTVYRLYDGGGPLPYSRVRGCSEKLQLRYRSDTCLSIVEVVD